MRKAVKEMLRLGPMPAETAADVKTVEQWEKLLHQIQPLVSKHEAEALLIVFGPDSFFGLAWTLVNLIETVPGWHSTVSIPESKNEWIQLLKIRASG
jgi:hypothetical protein